MYYTYMLRCIDNSIYTGITNDLEKRMQDHFSKSKNGAKYTKAHTALRLEMAWKTKEKADACKLEYWIKKLSKSQKEAIISTNDLNRFLGDKLSCGLFEAIRPPFEDASFYDEYGI